MIKWILASIVAMPVAIYAVLAMWTEVLYVFASAVPMFVIIPYTGIIFLIWMATLSIKKFLHLI
jgi:hypothetical protein